MVKHSSNYVSILLEEGKKEKPTKIIEAEVELNVAYNSKDLKIMAENYQLEQQKAKKRKEEREQIKKDAKKQKLLIPLERDAQVLVKYCVNCKRHLTQNTSSAGCEHCSVFWVCEYGLCKELLHEHEHRCRRLMNKPEMLTIQLNFD